MGPDGNGPKGLPGRWKFPHACKSLSHTGAAGEFTGPRSHLSGRLFPINEKGAKPRLPVRPSAARCTLYFGMSKRIGIPPTLSVIDIYS